MLCHGCFKAKAIGDVLILQGYDLFVLCSIICSNMAPLRSIKKMEIKAEEMT